MQPIPESPNELDSDATAVAAADHHHEQMQPIPESPNELDSDATAVAAADHHHKQMQPIPESPNELDSDATAVAAADHHHEQMQPIPESPSEAVTESDTAGAADHHHEQMQPIPESPDASETVSELDAVLPQQQGTPKKRDESHKHLLPAPPDQSEVDEAARASSFSRDNLAMQSHGEDHDHHRTSSVASNASNASNAPHSHGHDHHHDPRHGPLGSSASDRRLSAADNHPRQSPLGGSGFERHLQGGSAKGWAQQGRPSSARRLSLSSGVDEHRHPDLARSAENLFKGAQWGKKKSMNQVFEESTKSMASHHSDLSNGQLSHRSNRSDSSPLSHRSHHGDSPVRGTPIAHSPPRGSPLGERRADHSPYHTTIRTPRQNWNEFHAVSEGEEEEVEVIGNDVLGVVEVIDGEVHSMHEDYEHSDYGDDDFYAQTKRPGGGCLPCCHRSDQDADIPDPNCWGCSTESRVRRLFMQVAINPFVERVWLASSIAHTTLLLLEQHEISFTAPQWTEALFMGVYLLELVIKGTAWGLWGGRYAYLNYDVFNRIDFLVTISSIGEYIAVIYGKTYSLRGFRLCRLLRPLLKMEIFQDIGSILNTLEIGAVALFTVIYLMIFVFVLFGVVGMAVYGESFERRCVWADTMEIKQPEQWCKRYDEISQFGLDSSCGALQVCLNVGSPSYGFTHFNHMGAAMLAIFQAFSTDGQYAIMWATLQAEPTYAPMTLIYWMSIGFILGQILVNVFLAVLASVFTRVREEQEPEPEPEPELAPEDPSHLQPERSRESLNSLDTGVAQSSLSGLSSVDPLRTPVSIPIQESSRQPVAQRPLASMKPPPSTLDPSLRKGGLASMRPQLLSIPPDNTNTMAANANTMAGVGALATNAKTIRDTIAAKNTMAAKANAASADDKTHQFAGSHFGDSQQMSAANAFVSMPPGANPFVSTAPGANALVSTAPGANPLVSAAPGAFVSAAPGSRGTSPAPSKSHASAFGQRQPSTTEGSHRSRFSTKGRGGKTPPAYMRNRRHSFASSDQSDRPSSAASSRHSSFSHEGELSGQPTHSAMEPSPPPHVASLRERVHYLPSPRKGMHDHVEKPKASFGEKLSLVFRSKPFEVVVLIAILGNSAVLAMVGYVEGIDWQLKRSELVFSIFFTAELAIQVMCDGSLSKYFERGEHVFDFVTVAPTVIKLVTQLAGAQEDSKVVGFLSALGIVRLLRACKYFFLRPLWLMLIKAASSWVPAFNLVLFIMVFMSAWTILGRALFSDRLENPRANFDTFFKGFLTLFQIFTGDSWTAVLYDGMKASCYDEADYNAACLTNGGYCTECEPVMTISYAMYYILFFWIGQYVFITMFLALILEKFSVHEFMTIGHQNIQDIHLTRSEALEAVGQYQHVPAELVSERLVKAAFALNVPGHRTNPSATISKLALIKFVKRKQPKRLWRLAHWTGLVFIRRWLRMNIFCCLGFLKCCRPWPGDPDWGKVEVDEKGEVVLPPEELERQFAVRMAPRIRESMKRLVQTGMVGEVRMIAEKLGIASQLAPDLVSTAPEVALKLLKDQAILQRLGFTDMEGLFASELVAERAEMAQKVAKLGTTSGGEAAVDLELEEEQEAMDAMVLEELAARRSRLQNFNVVQLIERGLLHLSISPVFDVVVYSCIIVGSIFLAMETPAVEIPGPLPRAISEFAGYLFTGVFALEAMAKIAAFGFFMPKEVEYEAYWQDGWNRLDFLVLLFAIADLAGLGALVGSNTTRIIRVSRSLRPLRLMGRNKGMKTIISALIGSTKPITYATLFLFMITTIFAVLGMALFKDSFGSCNDTSLDGLIGEGRFECMGTITMEGDLFMPRVWTNPISNFDTFPRAIQTLCRVFTLKWVSVWFLAMDATGPGIQPVENTNVAMGSLFFVLFIFVGSFFSLNLFVSFIVDGFYAAQGVDSQFDEIQYASVKKMVFELWPKRYIKAPMNIISLICRGLVMSVWFRMFSGVCLMVNIVCMTLTHQGQSADFENFLNVQNNVFFTIMCVELFLTIIAWGPTLFLADGGYVFDLFLVFATMITLILADSFRGASQGVRVLRLVRFLRMMQSNSIVESVFETVLLSLKQVANVLVVIFLVMSVFAVVGVSSYGTTKFGLRLGTQANFRSYPWAMLTLFQIMFGEEWHMLMDDCLVQPPFCTHRFVVDGEELSYGDCGSTFSPVYFLSFIVMCNFTMINLFVGMIINNFSFCSNKDANGIVTPAHVEHLAVTWVSKFDEDATAYIPLTKVYQLMHQLGEPMGFYGTDNNIGRFLCIRQDLQLILQEAAKRDAANSAPERILSWLRALEKRLEDERYEEWRIMQEEAAAFDVDMMAKDKARKRDEDEDEEDENNSNHGSREGGPSEEGGPDESDGDPLDAEEDDEDPERRKKRLKAAKRLKAVMGKRFGYAEEGEEVWVAGGNLGKKREKGKRDHRDAEDVAEEKRMRAFEQEQREASAKREFFEGVKRTRKPRKTPWMLFIALIRWIIANTLVAKQRTYQRKENQLRYDEVVETLLYWNKKDSIVPKRVGEERTDRDADIIQNVAAQMISALIKGAVQRRRIKKMREKKAKLRHLAKYGRKMSVHKIQEVEEPEEDPAIKEEQEQEAMLAKAAELIHADAFEPGATKDVLATLLVQKIITYKELKQAAAECGVEVSGEEGVFALEEMDLEPLLSHSTISGPVKDLRVREDVEMLVGAGYAGLLREAAEEVGATLPALGSQHWHELDLATLRKLLQVEKVKVRVAILRAQPAGREEAWGADGRLKRGGLDHHGSRKQLVTGRRGHESELVKAAEEKEKENAKLRDQMEKEREERVQLARVLEETQKRYLDAKQHEEEIKKRIDDETTARESLQAKLDIAMAQAAAAPALNGAKSANNRNKGRPETEAPVVTGGGWRRKKVDDGWGMNNAEPLLPDFGGSFRQSSPPASASPNGTANGERPSTAPAPFGHMASDAPLPGQVPPSIPEDGEPGGGGASGWEERPKTTGGMQGLDRRLGGSVGMGLGGGGMEGDSKSAKEKEVELQDALAIKKAELERLQGMLSKVQAQKRADKKLAALEGGVADAKSKQRLKQLAFDPSNTASLSTAAALGLDVLIKKPTATSPSKKSKQPSWL